jgi:hypothetical protein
MRSLLRRVGAAALAGLLLWSVLSGAPAAVLKNDRNAGLAPATVTGSVIAAWKVFQAFSLAVWWPAKKYQSPRAPGVPKTTTGEHHEHHDND